MTTTVASKSASSSSGTLLWPSSLTGGAGITTRAGCASGAYYFAQDPHSDIYFLNVMPPLIAIEYFSFSFALLIVIFTSVLHVAVTLLIPAENGILRWFERE